MLIIKSPGKIRLTTTLLALAILLLPGCDSRVGHQTLTFFFTGVPPLEEGAAKKEQKPEPDRPEQKLQAAPTAILSAHSYFSERKCAKCHLVTKPVGSGRNSRKPSQTAVDSGNFPDPTLAYDLGICINCHKNPFAAVGSPGGRIHAPVACTICHVPHQSEYPHLLRDEAPKICTICHQEEKPSAAGFHKAPLRSGYSE